MNLKYLSKFNNIKNNNLYDIAFITIFIILLFIPISHISNEIRSEQENRMLAKKPKLINNNGLFNYNFGKQFESWFNDRFFGRSFILKLYYKIKLKFSLNFSNNVLIGKSNWLFYKLDNSLMNFSNTVQLTKKELKNGLDFLKSFDNWCKKNNKEFYYVIAPDKNKIYGEYYQLVNKLKSNEYGIGNKFLEYITNNSNIKAIYLYDILIKNKNKGLLYYKHDTHWNELGAYYGYIAIMNIIGLQPKKFEFIDKNYINGDLYNMINKQIPIDNSYYKVLYKQTNYCKEISQNNIKCDNNSNQKRLLILRDSFATSLIPYLSEMFKNITTYHYYQYDLSIEKLEFIKHNFDIIILENVERNIPSICNFKFPKG